jgi:hypothetical protein
VLLSADGTRLQWKEPKTGRLTDDAIMLADVEKILTGLCTPALQRKAR